MPIHKTTNQTSTKCPWNMLHSVDQIMAILLNVERIYKVSIMIVFLSAGDVAVVLNVRLQF